MPDSLYDVLDPDQLKKPSWMPKSAQQEAPGLAPKIDTGAAPPNLSQFGEQQPQSILGDKVAPGEPISPKQMPQAEGDFHHTDPFHGMLKSFGDRKAMVDSQMPTDIHDPNYLPSLVAHSAIRNSIKEDEAQFKKEHPWGSSDPETGVENHPGFWGKIGHVAATIGNVAGSALAPNLTAAIPGSRLNLNAQEASGAAGVKEAVGEATELQKANAAETSANARQGMTDIHAETDPAKVDTANRAQDLKENTLPNQVSGEAFNSITSDPSLTSDQKIQKLTDLMKQEKSATKPVNFQDKTGMDGKGNPARALFNPDPNAATPYLHADHTPFPDFRPSPTPTTNPQVPVFVPGATPGSAKLNMVHPGQSFDATNAINPSQLTATNKSVTAEQGSVNSIKGYQQDFQQNRAQLQPADLESLKVLTSHAQQSIAHQLFQDAGSGVLDALVGQPFTNYTQKLMQGTMNADQYGQLSKAGQNMLFGYTHAIVANFVNMKQKLGSIGRNPDQIQAEMANIPVPYVDTNVANEAFKRTLRDAQGTTFNPFGQAGDQSNVPSGNRRVIDLTH